MDKNIDHSQLKFIVRTENGKIRTITASIIDPTHSKKTIHLTNNVNKLFHYAKKISIENDLDFEKIGVNLPKKEGKNFQKQTITYSNANFILSKYKNNCDNKRRKVVRNALIGLSGIISAAGAIDSINYNFNDSSDSSYEIELLEDPNSLIGNITNEVRQNAKIPQISVEDILDEEIIDEDHFQFDYEDRSTSECVSNAKRHMNIFEKYGKMYGIDPNLLMAIMCQESSGIHHEYSQNGCAIGGMQIENFWYNKQLTAYNFELQEREEITVSEEMLSDLYYNVKVASMILQNNLEYFDYNIPKAVQAYNYGIPNMEKLGTDWTYDRVFINNGDPKYFEHVFSFLPHETSLSIKKTDNTSISLVLENTLVNSYQAKNM